MLTGMCWRGAVYHSQFTPPIPSDFYLINTGERLGKVRELHFPSLPLVNWERNFKKIKKEKRTSSFLKSRLTKMYGNGLFNAQTDKGIASVTI